MPTAICPLLDAKTSTRREEPHSATIPSYDEESPGEHKASPKGQFAPANTQAVVQDDLSKLPAPKVAQLPLEGCKHMPLAKTPLGSATDVHNATLRIMTWNVEGFATAARRLKIISFLWTKRVDIAVLTESHLLDEDIVTDPSDGKERIMHIQLDHYCIAHWRNRESTIGTRCGGVLILARAGIDCTLVPQDLLPERPISCCSLIVTAVGGCCQPFRITGVYLPPPAHSSGHT